MTNPKQCIHIPDGSIVISGELFDEACAAIGERGKLVAEIERLDTDAAGERAERESWKHGFKNFHRLLCDRFGYAHDEKDWLRDQLSLIEHIAKRGAPETPERCLMAGCTAPPMTASFCEAHNAKVAAEDEPVCYYPCAQHLGVSWTMTVGWSPPIKSVCPICEPPRASLKASEPRTLSEQLEDFFEDTK